METEIGQLKRHNNLPPTPWKDIFTSVPIIVLIIAQVFDQYIELFIAFILFFSIQFHFCLKVTNDYVFYVLASDLPKYMKEVLGFSVADVGFYSSMPYLLMWIVSLSSGFICDHLISGQYITVTQARKLFAGLCERYLC